MTLNVHGLGFALCGLVLGLALGAIFWHWYEFDIIGKYLTASLIGVSITGIVGLLMLETVPQGEEQPEA